MPVSGFLSSIADKAQSAINASPLAGHIPGYQRPNSPDPATQPSANEAVGSKSHTLESLQHQFRFLQQQYSYGLNLSDDLLQFDIYCIKGPLPLFRK